MERRHSTGNNVSDNTGGKGDMIKPPIQRQDLRRKIYIKAKADKFWRCKVPLNVRQVSKRLQMEEME